MDRIKGFLARRYIYLTLLFSFIAVVLYQIPDILMLFFVSFVIASALNPAVDWLNKKMHRGLAVLIIYLGIFLLSVVVLVPIIHTSIKQIVSLLKHLPMYISFLYSFINDFAIAHHISYKMPHISQIISSASMYGKEVIEGSIIATVGFAGSLIVILTSAMIILYMLLDKDYLFNTYLKCFPAPMRKRTEEISVIIARKVGGFVVGQIISLAAVAVLTMIGYILIGLNYNILLGLLTGILDIIPIVGPFLAVSIAVIIALAQNPCLVVWVVVIFCLIQWSTNVFVRPVVFSKFLDLHPLVIIFAILVAGSKLGVVGVIISPAIAATICILIDELYIKRINSDKVKL